MAVGRQALGVTTRARWGTATDEKRQLLQTEVRQMEEHTRTVQAISLTQQGSWLNSEGTRQKKLTWSNIWSMDVQMKSVYDVLPSPTNFVTRDIRGNQLQALGKTSKCRAHPVFMLGYVGGWTIYMASKQGYICPCKCIREEQEKAREGQKGMKFVTFVRKGE